MDISGNQITPGDKERFDEWRKAHLYTMTGIEVDPELPLHGFRTAGEVLYVSSDIMQRMRECKIPPPEVD